MRKNLLFAFLLVLTFTTRSVYSQDMYKNLKREHGMMRYGVGLQLAEPATLNLQLFHGFFCSNSDSYATYNIIEIGVGTENLLGMAPAKTYADGTWKKGGFRAEVNYLVPLLTLDEFVVLQVYGGAGLQTGLRNYTNLFGDQSRFATGLNGLLRAEVTLRGIELGDGLWFWSFFADAKYHQDFSESFNYFTPAFGIRIRKGR